MQILYVIFLNLPIANATAAASECMQMQSVFPGSHTDRSDAVFPPSLHRGKASLSPHVPTPGQLHVMYMDVVVYHA